MSERDISALAERLHMSVDEVKRRVKELADTKFSAIPDEKKRMMQAFIYYRAKMLAKPVGKDLKVIVYGLREPIQKAKRKIARVYVIYSTEEGDRKGVITLFDDMSVLYQNAQLFHLYTVNVVETGKGALLATANTNFVNGKPVDPQKVLAILKKDTTSFVEFEINNAYNMLSRMNGQYYDEFDLRATQGIVTRANYKKDEKGDVVFGVYELSDPNNPDSTLTCWIPPPLYKYDEGSELYMYGTLQMDKNGVTQFMVQGIIPITPIPLV